MRENLIEATENINSGLEVIKTMALSAVWLAFDPPGCRSQMTPLLLHLRLRLSQILTDSPRSPIDP